MEVEHRLLAHVAAALRALFAEAEVEATVLWARVERLEREATERDELLSALLAATRPGDAYLHCSFLRPPPLP